jgi:predicted metalloprotease with PDZ domain
MKYVVALLLYAASVGHVFASPGPTPSQLPPRIPEPQDRPFPGKIELSVDATDLERRIIHVHEHLTGIGASSTLLFPKWLPGDHAPTGTLDRFSGLKVSAAGTAVAWTRDSVDVWAFHIQAPKGAAALDIQFDYLSPTSEKVGKPEASRDLLILEWNSVVLYPAGFFSRQIPVMASVTLPEGFKLATSLEIAGSHGASTQFKEVGLETLVDSPIYAGRYSQQLDLDPQGLVPVHMDLFADRPESLQVKPEQLAAYRALVQQAYKLYGSHHYAHYDFLYSLSDQVEQNGLEHQQSSEDGHDPEAFTDWDKMVWERDLLAHEYTHSWNGKFRRPADLWTPNYNVPMQDSLLWVYEGQTEYWGHVLAARAGLWSKQDALDQLALTAAFFESQSGRQWRPLQDTVSDEIINPRRPMAWRDYQRYEDYYAEGAMIWLDVDTLLREQSAGKHSLDDFAKAFFGINDGSTTIVTYTFEDVVKTLNALQPYDWRSFLRQRLDSSGKPAFLDGVHRGGYELAYTDTPSKYQKARDDARKRVNLWFSMGVELDKREGTVDSVMWGSPAFKAGITESSQLLSINGTAYSDDVLLDALRSAQTKQTPLELILRKGDRYSIVQLDYHGGLRYPHLQRNQTAARLDDILAARP